MRFSAKLEVLLGILTILTGFLYAFELFGPTEPIVATWGSLVVMIGVGIVFLGINKHNIAKFIEMVIVFFLVIIQTPPIILWIAFNGSGISDGTPDSNFCGSLDFWNTTYINSIDGFSYNCIFI